MPWRRPFKDPNYDLKRMEQSVGVQAVKPMAEAGVQAGAVRPRPNATQVCVGVHASAGACVLYYDACLGHLSAANAVAHAHRFLNWRMCAQVRFLS